MAKRIAFASVEYVYDFTTKEEAKKFVTDNQMKGWWFETIKEDNSNMCKYPYEYVYNNGGDEYPWSVVVRKQYKDYNPGW